MFIKSLSLDPVTGLIVIRVRRCGENRQRIGGGDCQSSTWQWCRSFCSEYKIRSVPRGGRSDLEEHTALRKQITVRMRPSLIHTYVNRSRDRVALQREPSSARKGKRFEKVRSLSFRKEKIRDWVGRGGEWNACIDSKMFINKLFINRKRWNR